MKLLFMKSEWNAQVWIGWIISGVVVVVVSISLTYVTVKHLRYTGVGEHNTIRAGTLAWYLFGTMVSQGLSVCQLVFDTDDLSPVVFFNLQGDYCRFRHSSQKILVATWCLIAFVFVNVYNSTLTSYMSVIYQRPVINSMSDLAANPSYKMTVLTGSINEIDLEVNRNFRSQFSRLM